MANCPNLFAKKYRIKSTRLQNWDYSSPWWYFVTICTKDGICRFGNVVDGEMRLSEVGEIARKCWQEIPEHFDNVLLDEFIVMPNHIHGILSIDRKLGRDVACNVSTENNMMSEISPKPGSLSTIIRSFKSAATRLYNQNGYKTFAWQPRFYDHIIRNENSLDKIRFYIHYNARKWKEDEYHPQKLKITSL